MNDEYMPTTDKVRDRYAGSGWQYDELSYPEFDRWLAEHDRAVAEKAWDEGYESGRDDEAHYARGLPSDPGADEVPHDNPHRPQSVSNQSDTPSQCALCATDQTHITSSICRTQSEETP